MINAAKLVDLTFKIDCSVMFFSSIYVFYTIQQNFHAIYLKLDCVNKVLLSHENLLCIRV